MAQSVSYASFFQDLFIPLPEQGERRKDPFDHIAEYVETLEGAGDLFRFGYHGFSTIEMLAASASHAVLELVGKVKGIFDFAGAVISIPRFLSNSNLLRRSLTQVIASQDLPYEDPLRNRKIAQAVKSSVLDSVNLVNTGTQGALFFNSAIGGVLFEAAQLSIIDGVYNLTGGISDTVELIGEGFKLQQYNSPDAQPRNQAEAVKLGEKKTLAWMTIAKDVASIVMAFIALAPLAASTVGYTLVTAAIISPTALLAMSAFWLTMKITSYFYGKLIVEAPITA